MLPYCGSTAPGSGRDATPDSSIASSFDASTHDDRVWPTAASDAGLPEEYAPPGGRRYAPAVAAFRCAPVPPVVTPATVLPAATADADDAIRTALQAIEITREGVRRFE